MKIGHFIPTIEKTSAEGLACLFRDHVWKLHGLPNSIISDRSPQFVAGIMRELNTLLGIESKLSTAYHPQTDGQIERMNQELEQYLRMFIDHQQEQWPEWLGMAEFAYNNKVHTATKIFEANSEQNPRMGFKIRKTRKYKNVGKFVEKVQSEAKVALVKVQEDMKWYADRNRGKIVEYKVGDLVMLSTKDLKWQMVGRHTEKLTKRFVGPYKVKKVVSANSVKLDLPKTIRIYPVVNVSRIHRYIEQVEGQKAEQLAPVIVKGEEEWEVEKILNKQRIRGKDKYLVRWKGFTVESDTWEKRENLRNAKEAIEEFEKEYRKDQEEVRQQERREDREIFGRGELPERFTTKKLYG